MVPLYWDGFSRFLLDGPENLWLNVRWWLPRLAPPMTKLPLPTNSTSRSKVSVRVPVVALAHVMVLVSFSLLPESVKAAAWPDELSFAKLMVANETSSGSMSFTGEVRVSPAKTSVSPLAGV